MNRDTLRWITRCLSFVSLGALGGITVQKSLPFNEWAAPSMVVVFLVAAYIYAYLPGGEQ